MIYNTIIYRAIQHDAFFFAHENSVFSHKILCPDPPFFAPDPFLARIRVSGPPKYTWSTAKAEIAQPRRPKLPILNLGLLFPCVGIYARV